LVLKTIINLLSYGRVFSRVNVLAALGFCSLPGDATVKCYFCNTIMGNGSANCVDPFKSAGVPTLSCSMCMKSKDGEHITFDCA